MSTQPKPQSVPRRNAAMEFAEHLVHMAFRDRKGHGGGVCSYRQMDRTTLQAFFVTAFEAGAQWELRR